MLIGIRCSQVGEFGLARRQPIGDREEETRVLGTIGYLAPEYAETGKITDKADVYAFGVVLLELITGCKAIDYTRPRNQFLLTEWVIHCYRSLWLLNIIAHKLDPGCLHVLVLDSRHGWKSHGKNSWLL